MGSDLSPQDQFAQRGWLRFPYDQELADWATAARRAGQAAAQDPKHAHWWQCGDTWFVGVDVLENNTSGAVDGVELSQILLQHLSTLFGDLPDFHPRRSRSSNPDTPSPATERLRPPSAIV